MKCLKILQIFKIPRYTYTFVLSANPCHYLQGIFVVPIIFALLKYYWLKLKRLVSSCRSRHGDAVRTGERTAGVGVHSQHAETQDFWQKEKIHQKKVMPELLKHAHVANMWSEKMAFTTFCKG